MEAAGDLYTGFRQVPVSYIYQQGDLGQSTDENFLGVG